MAITAWKNNNINSNKKLVYIPNPCKLANTLYQEYIIKEESIEPVKCVRKVTWFCTFGTGSAWRNIACFACHIGRTRCFDHYLPSREFSRDTDFIPAISYTRHCVSYLISWLSRYFPNTFTISYIGSSILSSFIIYSCLYLNWQLHIHQKKKRRTPNQARPDTTRIMGVTFLPCTRMRGIYFRGLFLRFFWSCLWVFQAIKEVNEGRA